MGNPNVFVIESLSLDNEKAKFMEGNIISNVLNFYSKKTHYYYIRTKKELVEIMKEFVKSECKYLHFSSHANENVISFTYDDISYLDFSNILGTKVKGKRLFFSSCLIANDNFAKIVFEKTNCLSLTGFEESVYFQDSSVIWASFYTLMFNLDENKMPNDGIIHYLQKLSDTFLICINYYQRKSKTELLLKPKNIFKKYSLIPSNNSLKKEMEFLKKEISKKKRILEFINRNKR